MNAVDAMRITSAASGTAERIEQAWWQANRVVRRSALAAVLTSVALAMLPTFDWWQRSMLAITGVLLALAALVDVNEHRLPNPLLRAALVATFAGPVVGLDPFMTGRAISGALIAGGAMLLVRLLRGVGMGDVKMAGVIGASVGSVVVIGAPIALAVAASAASLFGLLARRHRLALGPALWLGWAVALVALSAGW